MFKIFVFLGVVLIFTQGGIVRRAVPKFGEKPVLIAGLAFVSLGILIVGFANNTGLLYTGLAALGLGSGLTNPAVSALVSLYSPASQQGGMLGIFRALGSLARAIGPLTACFFYWWFGGTVTYLACALLVLIPWCLPFLSLNPPNELASHRHMAGDRPSDRVTRRLRTVATPVLSTR